MFLVFQRTKATPYVSSSFDNHMATLYASSPCDKWMVTDLFPYFENSPHVDFFGGLFLNTKYGWGICLTADTYMAHREWGPHMLISPCNDREGGREIASPTIL